MRRTPHIPIPEERLADFCRRHHIRSLSFFGSVLREDFHEGSDVDVLVEFDPEHIPGLIRFSQMELDLTDLLGRKVDLHTPASLSPYIRARVIGEAQVQYAA